MILFVNPPSSAGVYQGLGESLAAIEPPIWARLLSSYCERKGIETAILDADAEGYDVETAIDKAVDIDPKLVVVVAHGQQPSASTQVMPAVIYFCQRFKAENEDVPILVVGGHPTALPERTLEETGADFVCTGEGPLTISGLYLYLETFDKKWKWGNSNVKGLVYWDHDETVRTDPAENVWNLTEEMPGGMWEKLPMGKYRAHNWHAMSNEDKRRPYASICSSLGCPYACSFCNIQNPFRQGDFLKYGGKANSYRMWNPKRVVDEIELLVEKYGISNIKIADEMFVLNRNHVLGICGEIAGRGGLGGRLNMWAYARVDTIKDDAMLDVMRVAGIRWVALGIESASEFVRDGVDKADYGPEDIYWACEKLRAHGINLIANFIVGLPDDTAETMRETMRMVYTVMPDFLNLYACQTYPGSPLWGQAQKEGWELSYDWRTYAHHGYECIPARTRTLSSAEILKFRDEAFQKFYTSPAYQSHVLTRFGPEAAVEIAEMARTPLRRKLLGD